MKKTLIICHGDGDGVISAAIFAKTNVDAEIIITQPFLLDKLVISDDIDAIFIVDIAVNNKNVAMSMDFAKKYASKIVVWADHHQGGEILSETLGKKLLFDPEAPSCPALLSTAGYNVPEEWLTAANACDSPTVFTPTFLSKRYNDAFKVALIELNDGNKTAIEKIQRAFIEELLSGTKSTLLTDYGSRYEPIMVATKAAADSFIELINGVGIVSLGSIGVDKTALCMEGYKKYPILVVQFISQETGNPVSMVATNSKVNLVEMFGLPSGSPFRVNLPGDHETAKKMIAEKLGASR